VKWVKELFYKRKEILRGQLRGAASKINISADGSWSDCRDNYVGVCSHFVSSDGQLCHILLGLKKIKTRKTGENQAVLVKEVLDDYGIERLGSFMGDNATDNDTLVESLAKDFDIDPKQARVRCLGHIINLVIKSLLFGKGLSRLEKELSGASDEDTFKIWHKEGPIGKLHNIVEYILRSPDRIHDFADCQAEISAEDFPPIYQPISDGGIRWHSVAAMIKRAILLRPATESYQSRYVSPTSGYDLRKSFLTMEDWHALKVWGKVLETFRVLCETEERRSAACGAKNFGMISAVITGLSFMYKKLDDLAALTAKDAKLKANEHFQAGVMGAQIKLTEYFNKIRDSDLYCSAVALNTQWRLDWFKTLWSKYDNGKWVRQAVTSFRRLYDEYAAEHAAEVADETEQQQQQEVDETITKNEYLMYNRLPSATRATSRKRARRDDDDDLASLYGDEWSRYTTHQLTSRDLAIENPLQWWWDHRTEYPILSKMAFNVLSIPSMSAELERCFSQAKKLISDERNRLGEETVNACECQKQWQHVGVFGDNGTLEEHGNLEEHENLEEHGDLMQINLMGS
jgi:hypothetical protein